MAKTMEELERLKPQYAGSYEGQLSDVLGKIQNRPDFKYDVKDDPLYQGYKDQYIQQGKLAMKDTIGQAAALTGGYGNTYGQQVGQQAYDAYLQRLGEVIPSLYESAYGKYKDQGQGLLDQFGLLGQMRDNEYSRYQAELGNWENERAFQKDLETEEYNRARAAEQWQHQLDEDAYARQLKDQQFAYQKEQDALDRQRQAEAFAYQKEQDALERQRQAELLAYQKQQDEYARQQAAEKWDYQKQQDAYSRAWNEEARDYSRQQDAYSREWNEEARDYSRQQDAQDRQRQAYSSLASLIQSSGYYPSWDELEAAGMSRAAADALANEYNRGLDMDERNMAMKEWSTYNSGSGGGYSSGGGGGRSSGGGGGYIVDVDPYAGTFSYGGDIYHDSLDYATDFGSSAAMNDLSSLFTGGGITYDQYALGTAGVATAGIRDYTSTLNDLAEEKKRKKATKTAGEDWNEVRKRLGI